MARPREHDRDAIRERLIVWAQKDDSTNLCGFCAEELLDPSRITQWANEDPKFQQAYRIAKNFIAQRREKLLSRGLLHTKAYDLNAATYDHFLKEERREQLKYESDLKKDEMKDVSQADEAKFCAIMSQLSSLQTASTKSKTESKS